MHVGAVMQVGISSDGIIYEFSSIYSFVSFDISCVYVFFFAQQGCGCFLPVLMECFLCMRAGK